MTTVNITPGKRGFQISWDDRPPAEYPFIWLRDNDPDELHPDTRERTFDLTSVSLEIRPDNYAVKDGSLVVNWPGKTSPSIYTFDWLQRHRPGRARVDASLVECTFWDRETLPRIPRFDAEQCAAKPTSLREALLTLKEYGLVIVSGLQDSSAAGERFGELIGFKRETNFGVMFEVRSEPRPNNLAYTAMALPLHTDLPNQELIPGYQFLHSFRNSASGGNSVFADGFKICADLRDESPQDFNQLTQVKIPWRFHDAHYDIRRRRPIISLGEDGSFEYFAFNAHIADVPDMEANNLVEFYGAYQRLMICMREARYSIEHKLLPGEMAIFDNTRVLHSRTAFDPATGERHFRGFYIEHNEVDSRIRTLV
ncbi:MAG: TauD/TfdA family dioxygenase [Gammaproteobacteria bacterium]|nr:TauD/TfdA family dioxygenase [Gammaproteobacteria bacterium]NNL51582.1 DUF971 domain-containing protein [Woeseiaceae bacterium]